MAASTSESRVCCARCGQPLILDREGAASETASSVPFEDMPEFVELEDWEFAEAIHVAQRIAREAAAPRMNVRYLPPNRPGPMPQQGSGSTSGTSHRTADIAARSTKASPTAAWLIAALGMGLFVCGMALIALALAHGRPQLWQLGLPLVLGGQVAVLAVLVWQLEVVWSSNRATFVALHAMDEQVRKLRGQWSELQQNEDAEQPFYRHLSENAPSEVLLADLKNQLDLLSLHLAQQKRAA